MILIVIDSYFSGSEIEVAKLPWPDHNGLGGVDAGRHPLHLEWGSPRHQLKIVVPAIIRYDNKCVKIPYQILNGLDWFFNDTIKLEH